MLRRRNLPLHARIPPDLLHALTERRLGLPLLEAQLLEEHIRRVENPRGVASVRALLRGKQAQTARVDARLPALGEHPFQPAEEHGLRDLGPAEVRLDPASDYVAGIVHGDLGLGLSVQRDFRHIVFLEGRFLVGLCGAFGSLGAGWLGSVAAGGYASLVLGWLRGLHDLLKMR